MKRKISELSIHPFNAEIYGTPDDGLKFNLSRFGLNEPIIVDVDGQILSGARRWTAAKELGWDEIDVRVESAIGELEAQKLILLANDYRVKTILMRKREADALRQLLEAEEVTKDELVERIKEKRVGKQKATAIDERTSRLVPRAAGLDYGTYRRVSYVMDTDKAEAEIERKKERGFISPSEAKRLKKNLGKARKGLEEGDLTVQSAERKIRTGIRDAETKASFPSRDDRQKKEAADAAHDAMRKGKAFLRAVENLQRGEIPRHLGARRLFVIYGTVYEAKKTLDRIAMTENLPLPTTAEEALAVEAVDVEATN